MLTKPEETIQVNKKRVRRGLHIPMVMDGGEGKKLKFFVLLRILNIRKKRENDGITEDGGVHSPMSKTRSKQGIEEKGGGQYNVSNTIVKQGLKGGL